MATTKRAVILPGPSRSDIRICSRCGGGKFGRRFSGIEYRPISWPVCLACHPKPRPVLSPATHKGRKPALVRLGKMLRDEEYPAPKPPRVVVVARGEAPTSPLKRKLAERWEMRGLRRMA